MESEDVFAKWKKFRPYNQVMYKDKVALITGSNKSGKYLISVIENGSISTFDVVESQLQPILLDNNGQILSACQPNKITPYACCAFCDNEEHSEINITFYNNYCTVKENGNEKYKGVISELHVLQNIIIDLLGRNISYQIK